MLKTTKFSFAARIALAAVFIGCAGANQALAQTAEHAAESSHDAASAEHKNLLALFVGVTSEGKRDNGLALGIEYERLLNRSFGVGIVAEHTFGDLDIWVFAIPLAYHTGRWKFYLAPGIEDGEHGSESLLRLGGEYAYEFGSWEISPQLDVDFVGGEQTLVLGLTFGKGF